MYWALIKDGTVQSVIVADAIFIELIRSQWDFCIQLNNYSVGPSVGSLYDSVTGQFTP